MTTTLIFVSSLYIGSMDTCLIEEQAGLFSAVASAFIIAVDSQLQPSSGDETAALLRVLIHKIDNTTFGNDVPTLLQRLNPPRRLVRVQAILFASLSVSLFAAFLAMLGKQWLNRYQSIGMQGSIVDRGQDRQRKLDGIDRWYFDVVVESLPVMLQAALLLLGCALSLYLWGIDTTIASVVVGITSFGFTFYLFIIASGVVSDTCPYQTPVSQFLCFLGRTFRNAITHIISKVPLGISDDASRRWKTMQEIPARIAKLFRVNNRGHPTTEPSSTSQTAVLDLRCISWTLRRSLEKAVRISALEYLTSVLERVEFHPSLVTECFDIFITAFTVDDEGEEAPLRELEQLATVSARCFYHILHRFTVNHPTSSVLKTIHRRYPTDIPDRTRSTRTPSRHSITMIHALITKEWNPLIWRGDRPSKDERISFAQDIAELAQAEYHQQRKVPDWILRFTSDSVSLDSLRSPSIVADCLKVSAIHLGCDVSNIAALEKRCICLNLISLYIMTEISTQVNDLSILITQGLKTKINDNDQALVTIRFNILIICYMVKLRRVVITPGLEQLAATSTECAYRTLYDLTTTNPTSSVLEEVHQRYCKAFPFRVNFTGLPSHHKMTMIHALINGSRNPRFTWRDEDRPSEDEHICFAQDIAWLAGAEYKRQKKVPGWILSFTFNSLSLYPLLPASVIADCLEVIAVGLGCDLPPVRAPEKRYMCLNLIISSSDWN